MKKAKVVQPLKGSAGGKGAKSVKAVRSVPQLPVLSFDYLGGEYRRKQTEKWTNYAVTGLVSTLCLLAVGQGALATLERADYASELEAVSRESAEQAALVGRYANIGSLTREQLEQHVETRSVGIQAAASDEIDLPRLLADLQSRVPDGVTLVSVTVTSAAPPPPPAGEGGEGGEGAAPPAEGAPVTAPPAPAAPAGPTVQIEASTGAFGNVAPWISVLEASPYLSAPVTKWSGSTSGASTPTGAAGGGGLALSTTAQIRDLPSPLAAKYSSFGKAKK